MEYPNFLIIGMERSGTHWVAGLLNSHPEIACFPSLPFELAPGKNKTGEVHFFDTLASILDTEYLFERPFEDFLTKYNKVFADLVPLKDTIPQDELIKKFKERYSKYCDQQRGEKDIVGESTPAYVFYLDLIEEWYPDIKKIAIIRDPKDKIVSWHFNLVRKDKKHPEEPITEEFAMGYLQERIIPEYRALLDYEGGVHIVSYEALSVSGPETVRGMVEYLGKSANDEVVQSMIDNASFEKQTARHEGESRKKGEEDVKSGLRKGVAGDWKNHITSELAQKIDASVAELRQNVFTKYNVNE